MFGKAEPLGQKGTEFMICFSLQCRSVHLDFQGIAKPADNLVPWGVGNCFDFNRAAFHGPLRQACEQFAVEAVKGTVTQNHEHIARLKLRTQFFHDRVS